MVSDTVYSKDLPGREMDGSGCREGGLLCYQSRDGDGAWRVLGPIMERQLYGRPSIVWKNTMYFRLPSSTTFVAFDMGSETSSEIEVDLPCNIEKHYRIISNKDQVLLVQIRPKREDPIRIWKLLDATDSPKLFFSKWKKVALDVPVTMRLLVDEINRFGHIWCHGKESIGFATLSTEHSVTYSFGTKSWRVIPCVGRSIPFACDALTIEYGWLDFEPCVGAFVHSVAFNAGDYPALATHLRDRERNRPNRERGKRYQRGIDVGYHCTYDKRAESNYTDY